MMSSSYSSDFSSGSSVGAIGGGESPPPESSLISLDLNIQRQKHFVPGFNTGYRVTITVANAANIPEAIFRYLRSPSGTPGEDVDEFDGICSAADLEEFPENEPRLEDSIKFFRLPSLDLVFRSSFIAEEAIKIINKEVQILIDSLKRMQVLGTTTTVSFEESN